MSFCAIAEAGQTLAQTTGCLDILLDLFRYCTILKTIKARQHFYLKATVIIHVLQDLISHFHR